MMMMIAAVSPLFCSRMLSKETNNVVFVFNSNVSTSLTLLLSSFPSRIHSEKMAIKSFFLTIQLEFADYFFCKLMKPLHLICFLFHLYSVTVGPFSNMLISDQGPIIDIWNITVHVRDNARRGVHYQK